MMGIGRKSQSGNIFFALFGAVALVGILGAGVMTFMKGPLASSVRVTRINTAETQMALGAQVAVMAAANTATSGDCDSDGYVEPLEWRDAGASPKPTNGGLIPMSIGMSKKDPWGTEYGYCAWDHGTNGACDDETGAGDNPAERLAGASVGGAFSVVAIVSAGSDKTFTTTCRDFATADANADGDLLDAGDLALVSKAAETDDDIIFTFTYDEATGASGGLWSIKSGDPTTAVINKKIETTGTASLQGGVLLPDSSLITCDATTAGVMAKNASGGIDICDGAGAWDSISGAGTSTGFDTATTCTGPADAGNVRYNSVTSLPEFCDGIGWRPFAISLPSVNLILSPSTAVMNVDGATNLDAVTCTGSWVCGAETTFTLTNTGTTTSASPVVGLTNTTNFVIMADTCTGNPLDTNEACTIKIRPKANGNLSYSAVLTITAGNNPFSNLQGTSTNFGCLPGRVAPGGVYAACGQNDGDGVYDLIAMPGGCNGVITNPTCSGGVDGAAVARIWGTSGTDYSFICNADVSNTCKGAQQAVNLMALQSMGIGATFPAASYCEDMIYNGKTDWFLPNAYQLRTLIYPNSAAIGGFAATNYQSSGEDSYYSINAISGNLIVNMGTGSPAGIYKDTNTAYVRCVRRENLSLPSATVDINPDNITIAPSVSFTAGGAATSSAVTVTGILQTISVSMTGGAGMDIIKNGVSTGLASISGVKWGDTLAFTMDAPAVLGTKSTATITIGPDTYTWWVGYADSSRQARIFVTSTGYGSYLGGAVGADNYCEASAAASPLGLPSGWKALLSTAAVNAKDRIPWNWGTLKNLAGTTIVTAGIGDLFDGSILAPISITELGTTTTNTTWTGTDQYGNKQIYSFTSPNDACIDYTSNPYSSVSVGSSTVASNAWIEYSTTSAAGGCNGAVRSIYCFEDIDSTSDNTPTVMDIPYAIQVATSSRQTTSAIVVGGMSGGGTATLSVTATGGNPTFKVNGGSEVTSASVVNGDSVVFYLDAPATGNSNNKMTITANGSTTLGYWRVWTGDATGSVVKRVFVIGAGYYPSVGGPTGADSLCQSKATAASLGGTWKSIISGTSEVEYAINRIGYNWSELRLVDGTTSVVMAGNIWKAASTPLLSPIKKNETGALYTPAYVWSNTKADGKAYYTTMANTCNNFSGFSSDAIQGVSSAVDSSWISQGAAGGCSQYKSFFCIEQ